MSFVRYVATVLSNFLRNIHFLGKFNLAEEFYSKYDSLNDRLLSLDDVRRLYIKFYFDANREDSKKYLEELEYLSTRKNLPMLPYEQLKELDAKVQCGFDELNSLPYVVHDGKKMYFPSHWSVDSARTLYRYYVERENLLGGGYTKKAPHQYQSDSFKIESNDILLDVGCAEGLVALDSIDRVKKVYLFEADPIWKKPLEATFAPYRNKVTIVNKWVGGEDDESSIKLSSAIVEDNSEQFFVKMDIEGAEEEVVRGNADFFRTFKCKVACCTYHNADHYDNISKILSNWNYSISSSSGYVLCFMDNVFKPPFFRKGVLRASNIV